MSAFIRSSITHATYTQLRQFRIYYQCTRLFIVLGNKSRPNLINKNIDWQAEPINNLIIDNYLSNNLTLGRKSKQPLFAN